MPQTITIYTDGCAIPNPGNSGWAFVVYDKAGVEIHQEHGGALDQTNNFAELTAMLKALTWLRQPANRQLATIFSDSQYVVKGTNSWRYAWAKNGWRAKGMNVKVKNLELWQAVAAIIDEPPVLSASIQWVKGHVGIVGNERADHLTMVGAAAMAGCTVEDLGRQEKYIRDKWAGK